MQRLDNIVQFPIDAESSPFFSALSSALLPALGYTEDTPYFCAPKGSYCVRCGGCGDRSNLQKHQLALYHAYQTLTGVGFGWVWPDSDCLAYQTIDNGGPGWTWPDSMLDQIMGTAGLTWRRLSKSLGRDAIYREVACSIDRGFPVLARLGASPDWQVVTGCEAGALLGLDTDQHVLAKGAIRPDQYTDEGLFLLSRWFETLEDAVAITGRCDPTVTLSEILTVIVRTLAHPAHARLEHDLMERIDRITPENAVETAAWLNRLASFPIEARWHAAEAFCSRESAILRLTEDTGLQQRLGDLFFTRYIADNHDETHGVCWKIWGLLGIGPENGYTLAPDVGERVMRPAVRDELKRLFALVFANDRTVLTALRELVQTGAAVAR